MYQQPRHCLLTGKQFGENVQFETTEGAVLAYKFHPVGRVRIALPIVIEFQNNRQYNHPVLAGLCRNAFEMDKEPSLITSNFIQHEVKNLSYPKTFKEKCQHLLNVLYKTGSKDFKPRDLLSVGDYTICYADNEAEFQRVINYLRNKYFITVDHETPYSGGRIRYNGILLTDDGIAEVEKDLPQIPMIGLINQQITTDDSETDKNINHARQLFLQEPQTVDRMRSACETLSYVLEPLRKEMDNYFTSKDVNDFFQIVNAFDIRHNKDSTKNIEHPEQLEWVFYSLLNTINTYTKMKSRLELPFRQSS